ncbi:MAG: mechanosensitive ion channel family protein [Rhizobiaceae bacterium]
MIPAAVHRSAFLPYVASFFLALAVVMMPGALRAQTANNVLEEQKAVVAELTQKVKEISDSIDTSSEDDNKLVELRLQLESLAEKILGSAVNLRPRLNEIRLRLDQLGAAPGEHEAPEPDIVAEERASLTNERAEINALIGEAETLSVEVSGLIDRISELRRDLFARTLSKRYDLSFAFGQEVLGAFWTETGKLYKTFYFWLRFVVAYKLNAMLLATFFSLAAAIVIFIFGRRLVGPVMSRNPEIENPSYLSRLTVAFWSTLLPTLALFVFFILTLVLYQWFQVLRGDIREILGMTLEVVIVIFYIHWLAKAVLSPNLPGWRLLPVHGDAAHYLVWLVTALATATGLDFLFGTVFEVLGSPLQLTVATGLILNTIVGVLVLLIASVKPLAGRDGLPKRWPRIVRYPLYLLGLGTIAVTLFGYVGLAAFISQQIVVTSGILVTMYLGFLSAGAVSAEGAFQQTAIGRRMGQFFGLGEMAVDRIGVVISLLLHLLILLIGIPVVLLNWGFKFGDVKTWAIRAFSEINIGSVSISIGGILTGFLIFFVGYLATRWFERWLDGTVLARSRIDSGVRNSIRTAIGYAGIALAALIGVVAAGINLSSLALVAGALSLGIGFGLQNIVSNFVSGLILLAERPFKAGDWIVAGGYEGTVKRVNVRATEIETFQRQTILLPNSELINQAVGNWTHRNKLGRAEVAIGVAYGSDVTRVRDILMEIAKSHDMVTKNPEPAVVFKDFGASSLDFEVRMYLYDISNIMTVSNDVRYAIVEAFEQEGIEIPFPQRDIHIRTESAEAAADKARKAQARRRAAAVAAAKKAAEAEKAAAEPVPPRRRRRRKIDPDD